jgi:hypothetical protein
VLEPDKAVDAEYVFTQYSTGEPYVTMIEYETPTTHHLRTRVLC